MKKINVNDIINKLDSYKNHITQGTKKYNQHQIRSKYLNMNEVDVSTFNKIVDYVHSLDMMKILRTKSGGISKSIKGRRINCFAYDIRHSSSRVSLTILMYGMTWNFVVGRPLEKRPIDPIEAWKKFLETCKKFDIDFNDYQISKEEGQKLYDEGIPGPIVYMNYKMKETDEPLDNVHHIDLHSSYPSALTKMYPEFYPVISYLYHKRKNTKDKKEEELIKAVMNYTISGCTMSDKHPWYRRWTHIAKFVREYNDKRIKQLTFALNMSGREVLGVNTDGIWYRGKKYHDDNEGPNICQWGHDHTDCLFRSRSDGAYEFIENGVYNVVLRGSTKYDIIEPDRKKWKWGDLYRVGTEIIEFYYDEDKEKILKYESKDKV